MAQVNGNTVLEPVQQEPIAVIGLSFQFPQEATDVEGFWNMLMEGRCASTDIPSDRMNVDSFYHKDGKRHDSINFRGGHFMKGDLGAFDAPFFTIKPSEARAMDPHQRMLLETTYRALESAGLSLKGVDGSCTSVYTASFSDDYRAMLYRDPDRVPTYHILGTSQSLLANRISWFYNLKGASLNVDTACSSSLVAVDQACQNLLRGESSMSIATGGNIILDPANLVAHANLNLLSPDSRCFSFDQRANGYSTGEGIGVVVLQRLSDALRDGNCIRAVIRSTGTNSDGRTPGISQPSAEAQEALIRETYAKAGLSMSHTRFFEAHATGTAIGDPTEASAIAKAFAEQEKPLYVGAVKSNIGHLEGGSGIASLIKTTLILERGIIPPNTNFERLNPRIDEAQQRVLKFPSTPQAWPGNGLRRASVNSFGFGGTNCHIVIEDAYSHLIARALDGHHQTVRAPSISLPVNGVDSTPTLNGHTNGVGKGKPALPKLLVWSAADQEGVSRVINQYKEYLLQKDTESHHGSHFIDNLAYTLARRSMFDWRVSSVVSASSQLRDLQVQAEKPTKAILNPNLSFIFTGQGAQWPRMGLDLITFPGFRSSMLDADAYFQTLGADWSLMGELEKEAESSKIHTAALSQPVCTALQIALVDLLWSYSIAPNTVIGHSSGEIAAAYCTGAISREAAWRIAYYRGSLAEMLSTSDRAKGAMMSVGVSESEAQPWLSTLEKEFGVSKVYIACFNSAKNITLSGDEAQIDYLASVLSGAGIFHRKLKVAVPYHSPQMMDIASKYRTLMAQLESGHTLEKSPVMFSTLKGAAISAAELQDAQYWVDNLTSPVRFEDAISCLANVTNDATEGSQLQGPDTVLEIGPHPALQAPASETLKSAECGDFVYTSCLQRSKESTTTLFQALGIIHGRGHRMDLAKVNENPSSDEPARLLADLPEYPFNHSQTYWNDGLGDLGYRFRPFGRHDLLGIPVWDFDPENARWRHRITVSDLPWTKDHVVNGAILYPATGMIVMALEAMKLLAGPEKYIKAFRLRKLYFKTGLVVPNNQEGVETSFTVRRLQDRRMKASSWSEFVLSHYHDGKWIENSRGLISVELHDNFNFEDHAEGQRYQDLYQTTLQGCPLPVDTAHYYEHLKKCGLEYGPSFQCLEQPSSNGKTKSVSEVRLYEDSELTDSDYTVHPASLDAIFHLFYANVSEAAQKPLPTMVPTGMRTVWISNEGLKSPPTQKVNIIAETSRPSSRLADSSITALDSVTGAPRVLVEGIEVVAVANMGEEDAQQEPLPNQRYHEMVWKPDVTLMDHEELLGLMGSGVPDRPEQKKFFQDLTLLLLMSIALALKEVEELDVSSMKDHLQKYVSWMKRNLDLFYSGGLPGTKPEWKDMLYDKNLQQQLFTSVGNYSGQGRLFVGVAQNMQSVLRGEKSMQEVLFTDDLALGMYAEIYSTPNVVDGISKYLDALAHKDPNMRILEVGAGTGSGTQLMTDILSDSGKREIRCAQYDFTDISQYFFDKARARFSDHASKMRFRIFDIEKEATTQDVDRSYDLIIATGSIHVTSNLSWTLSNLRKILRPGGKLVVCDPTRPDILRTSFATGLLADWWLSQEEYREWTPVVDKAKWNELLLETGFSGFDLIIDDFHDEGSQEMSVMVSTAGKPTLPDMLDVTIITGTSSARTEGTMSALKEALPAIGIKGVDVLSIQDLGKYPQSSDSLYISLLEYEDPMLYNLDSWQFSTLKRFFLSARFVLWITGGASTKESPNFGAIDGLFRVLRNETVGVNFSTLALEKSEEGTARHIKHICKVVEEMFQQQSGARTVEFVERDAVLNVNRLELVDSLTEEIHSLGKPTHAITRRISDGKPVQLEIERPGLLDTLRFVEQEAYPLELAPQEVEIQVKAVGLTILDPMAAMGRTKTTNFGGEGSGIVTRAGSASGLQPGDRVAFCGTHTFRTIARSMCAAKIPDSMSFEEAAAIPLAFTMAYYALVEIAHAQPGESVVMHGGACGTGQACLQIAKMLGLELFATTEAAQLVVENFNLAEERVLDSKTDGFVKQFMRLTGGKGVDIVLNTLDEDGTAATWGIVAPFGRFIEIGPDFKMDERRLRLPEFSNLSYHTTDIFALAAQRPKKVQQILGKVMDLFREQKLKVPTPLTSYPISEVEKAFGSFSDLGKTVISIKGDEMVKTIVKTESFKLEEDATYVISGGLGACGREIASWMVSKGAKNLLLLSRYGESRQPEFVASLRSQGARISAPACDVGDFQRLKAVLKETEDTMPPIKGCIQCAMVVENRIFPKMTHEEWKLVTHPKIQGSWNLHTALPSRLSFFILMSSMSGCIGFPSQAHYGSGNTFQDRLARFRRSNNEKAVSLNLGPIDIAGQEYRTEAFLGLVYNSGFHLPQSGPDLCALIEYTCMQETHSPTGWKIPQIVMGIEDPANIRAIGKEEPVWFQAALFSQFYTRKAKLAAPEETNTADADQRKDITDLLKTATSDAEAAASVKDYLVRELAAMLGMKEEEIDSARPMNAYGVDSLVAIDIRTWFSTKVGVDISVFDIMGNASMEQVARMSGKKSSFRK